MSLIGRQISWRVSNPVTGEKYLGNYETMLEFTYRAQYGNGTDAWNSTTLKYAWVEMTGVLNQASEDSMLTWYV